MIRDRAACPACGKPVAEHPNGTVYAHCRASGKLACPGSFKPLRG